VDIDAHGGNGVAEGQPIGPGIDGDLGEIDDGVGGADGDGGEFDEDFGIGRG